MTYVSEFGLLKTSGFEIKNKYIFGSLDGDPANTSNRFHAKLQHCLATLLFTSALLGTPISSCTTQNSYH
uniref:Uncharacterized protein n=1 Tax=Salix viminalis TaxID=40686 RepID=A0A6N2LK50_SALVM